MGKPPHFRQTEVGHTSEALESNRDDSERLNKDKETVAEIQTIRRLNTEE